MKRVWVMVKGMGEMAVNSPDERTIIIEPTFVERTSPAGRIVSIAGYKHAMVQVISAAVANNVRIAIRNIPLVDDLYIMGALLRKSGADVAIEHGDLMVDPRTMNDATIDAELSSRIHGSLYLTLAYLVRFRRFNYHAAGGCAIGVADTASLRPEEHIWSVMRAFGARLEIGSDHVSATIEQRLDEVVIDIKTYWGDADKPVGPLVSGATKAALLLSPLARRTTIVNRYNNLDVSQLLSFLGAVSGFDIVDDGSTCTLAVEKAARIEELCFELASCPSEFMTVVVLSVLTGQGVRIKLAQVDVVFRSLKPELDLLGQVGVRVERAGDVVLVHAPYPIRPVDLVIDNDGIMSDHHPLLAVMLLAATGQSSITDLVWRGRHGYVQGLSDLGCDVRVKNDTVFIKPGAPRPSKTPVRGEDTRAAAALAVALAASARSGILEGYQHICRGYSNITDMFDALGFSIKPLGGHDIGNAYRGLL
jgi:UDP-N-acetylglucosamine 1-carboxyvinyltransferase